MRRRALLTAASGIAAATLAGCVGTTSAEYDLTVRGWQDTENRAFPVDVEVGDTIRIELNENQSHGASFEIFRPDLEGQRVHTGGAPTEYTVEEAGKHTILVNPCCAPGGGTSYAWVRIYVD